MRTYSADGKWYSDDGNTWYRMTAEDIRHRQVMEQLSGIRQAARRGDPKQMNIEAQAFLRRLLEKGQK